jgi:hypothetical protein
LAKTVMLKQQEKYRLSGAQSSSHQVNPEVPVTDQGAEEENDVEEANMEANVDRRISILEDDAPLSASTGNDKKAPVFPDTHEAFSFVVDILKRFHLHFVLDVALDPLQIGAVMRFVWKIIGYMFWKHPHLEEHLCKYFRLIVFILPCSNTIYTIQITARRSWLVPLFFKTVKFGPTSWNAKRELIQSRTREPMDLTSFPSISCSQRKHC